MRFINHDETSSRSDKNFGQAAVGMTHKLEVVGSIPALSTPVSLKFLPRWQLAAIAVAFAMLQRSRASAPQPPKCGSCGWGQQTAPINLRRLMETSTAIRTQPAAHMHVPPTHCAVFFAKSLDLDQCPSFALRASPGPSLKRSSSLAIPFPIPVLVYKPIPLHLRSDATIMIKEFIKHTRASPYYHGLLYKPFSHLKTDLAGEWNDTNKKFNEMISEEGVIVTYATTDRHEKSAPNAERACAIVENCIKGLLAETNLNGSFWQYAAGQAQFILNRVIPSELCTNMGIDGDYIRPIEALTGSMHSRAMITAELNMFQPVGTLALVHQANVKGSHLGPKSRFGVAVAMQGTQVIFMDPYTHALFHSKNFTALKLKGLNYAQFLHLPPLESLRSGPTLPTDKYDDVTVHLDTITPHVPKNNPPIEWVWHVENDQVTQLPPNAIGIEQTPGQGKLCVKHEGKIIDPIQGTYEPALSGGSIGPTEDIRETVQVDPTHTGVLTYDKTPETKVTDTSDDTQRAKHLTPTAKVEGGSMLLDDMEEAYIDVEPLDLTQYPKIINNCEQKYWTVKQSKLSFDKLCKRFRLPLEIHKIYRDWLINSHNFPEHTLKYGQRGQYLARGLRIPIPEGRLWQEELNQHSTIPKGGQGSTNAVSLPKITTSDRSNNTIHDEVRAASVAYEWVKANLIPYMAINTETSTATDTHDQTADLAGSAVLAEHETVDTSVETSVLNASARPRRKNKRKRAVAHEDEPPPKNIQEALNHPTQAYAWLDSVLNEWIGLIELGVIDNNYTVPSTVQRDRYNNRPCTIDMCV